MSSDKINDSEEKNGIKANNTGVSYICKDERVKENSKPSQLNSSTSAIKIDSSENEFISKLKNIVHKTNLEDNISNYGVSTDNEIDNENGSITARNIVEDVCKKSEAEIEENINYSSVESVDIELSSEILTDSSKDKSLQSKVSLKTLLITTERILDNLSDNIRKLDMISVLDRDVNIEIDSTNTNKMDLELIKIPNKFTPDDVIYYIIQLNSVNHFKLPKEMYLFYNKSWGGENFTVAAIQKTMDQNTNWSINSADRYPIITEREKLRCGNCFEFGHRTSTCPEPPKFSGCRMCGQLGHSKSLCPNAICLNCGSPCKTYSRKCIQCMNRKKYCYICQITGHSSKYCLDNWKKYLTVEPNIELNNNVLYNQIKYCCICSESGHFAEECKDAAIFLDNIPPVTEIKPYYPIIENRSFSSLDGAPISYSLLYDPNTSIKFNLSNNKEFYKNGYYGRFLKFVGLIDDQIELNSNNTVGTSEQKFVNTNYINNTFNYDKLESIVEK